MASRSRCSTFALKADTPYKLKVVRKAKTLDISVGEHQIGVLIAGTPAATANYIMAQQLKGDAELAGTIVMLSTLLSAVTYTLTLLILRSL